MSTPIRDVENAIIGSQDDDGTVRDKNNKKLGHIARDGTVYNLRKEQVGTIKAQGDVVDRWGRNVGSIDASGSVQDWHGVPIYNGSAAPLLLDFENKTQDPLPSRFDFDEMARRVPQAKTPRAPIHILPEGFVSPSMIGCLGIVAAIIIGFGIMYVFQNPSVLSRSAATPTGVIAAKATPDAAAQNSTPVPNAAPQGTTTPQQATGKVNTQILNLRQGPATSFEIVDRLQQDEQVMILGRLSDNVWLKVSVPGIGKEGWVAAQYLDTKVDVATLPVVPPPTQ